MDKLASCDTENESSRETESGASRETEIGLFAEAFRERPRAIRRMHPCRGLPWRASREAEIVFPAEAFRGEPRARRRLRQDAETSCARLEARRRAWWARTWRVRGPRLTF